MSIAPHVWAWEEEEGGWENFDSPPSLGGPGSVDFPLVDIFVNGTWVGISDRVRWGAGIQIRRGRSRETDQLETSSCIMTLENTDGFISPRNPLSPYFGHLKINTPIRVGIVRNGVTWWRFYGEVAEWPVDWDRTGRDVTVEIQASGIIRRLTQNSEPLNSAMYRNITRVAIKSPGDIVGYWPMEEISGSTVFSSPFTNHPSLTLAGQAPTAQGFTEFPTSDGALTLRAGSFTATVPAYTPGSSGTQFVRVLMHAPETLVASTQTVMRVITTGSARLFTVQVDTAGNIRLLIQDTDEVTIYNSGFLGMGDYRGRQTAMLLELTKNGADVDFQLRFADIQNPASYTPISLNLNTITNTVVGQTVGRIAFVQFGNNHGLNDWSFAHLTAVNNTAIFGELTGASSSALLAYAGENPSTRAQRLCREEGVSLDIRTKGQAGNTVGLGFQFVKTFIDLIHECARTDSAILLEPRDQIGIGYRSRLSLYNQSASLAVDYAASEPAEVPRPVDDDRYVINDVFANNESGRTATVNARATRETGPRNVQDPSRDADGIGRYQGSVSVNITTDQTNNVGSDGATSTLQDQANWAVHVGAWDEERYPQVDLDLHRTQFRDSVRQTNNLLALDQGDRFDVTNMPAWVPPNGVRQLLQGYQEFIGGSTLHSITLNATPARPWTVAFADGSFDGFFFRADTDGSKLTSAIDSTQTSFSVTTTGNAIWATSAGTIGIMVGGERMLATAIVGSSSPQTFTVDRSQNGIVKSHAADTDVRLFQQSTVQL